MMLGNVLTGLTKIFIKSIKKVLNFFGVALIRKPSLHELLQPKNVIDEVVVNHLAIQDSYFSSFGIASQTCAQVALNLLNSGYPDEAARCYELALRYKIDRDIYSAYLQCLLYTSPEVYSHEKIYQANLKWNNYFGPEYEIGYDGLHIIDGNRKIRIGYTCHFVDDPVSITFLLPLLEAHNKEKFDIYFYSDQNPSLTSERAKNSVSFWRNTHDLNDEQFTKLIRNDKIDVFLELNGYCKINRYVAIANRVAPIQISFYNIASTCGVKNMDYALVSDKRINIDNLQPYYSEKIIYTDYPFPVPYNKDLFPVVSEQPPCIENGYITFGSFGNIHKVSHAQIKVWSEILSRVPEAKFIFKGNAFDNVIFKDQYSKHFVDSGIELSRIEFQGHSSYTDLLEEYNKIDIALDTYPHAAGTTTINALYQGVPVITLAGERQCSKHGISHCYAVKAQELISYSEEEYIAKAVELANDFDRIALYRKNLRDNFIKYRSSFDNYIMNVESIMEKLVAHERAKVDTQVDHNFDRTNVIG